MVIIVTVLRVPFRGSWWSILFWANTLQVGFHSQPQSFARVYLWNLKDGDCLFPWPLWRKLAAEAFRLSWSTMHSCLFECLRTGFFFQGHLMGPAAKKFSCRGQSGDLILYSGWVTLHLYLILLPLSWPLVHRDGRILCFVFQGQRNDHSALRIPIDSPNPNHCINTWGNVHQLGAAVFLA